MFKNIRRISHYGIFTENNKIKQINTNFRYLNDTIFKDNGYPMNIIIYPKNFYAEYINKNNSNSNNNNNNDIYTPHFGNVKLKNRNNNIFKNVITNKYVSSYNKNNYLKCLEKFHSISSKNNHNDGDLGLNGKWTNEKDEKQKKTHEQTSYIDKNDINNYNNTLNNNNKQLSGINNKTYNKNNIWGRGKFYLKNVHSILITKKIKEMLINFKSKHSYKIVIKRIEMEKKLFINILKKYKMKSDSLKHNSSEEIYRKAIMNTKKKISIFLRRNSNKSFMDIYYEEKKKYKLRKEKLLQSQEKLINKSRIAHSNIKNFFKKYGYVGLGIYFGVFLITFCASYFFVHFKYISLSDLKYLSEKMHLNKYIDDNLHKKIDSLWGELIFAYIASKITEPLRIVITVIITPYIAKVIRIKKGSRIKHG
ncbi:conserved Plasmodium protein, unknown function [Plasmodium berghei]|uniref:DUF1279 domain-containing protein n=2 Tax=Plasmodium berghei TaxID=5821 RepID=A0A509AP08_PLABA|nr:conserved protein, unknown function [Plasmodium berghei ANKA]CXI99743.1 conserved Plasmodium protein, unknown function [Plasmodium berghei]SCL97905.1 conserved Plasmodium protein, unknown function [Plasmodium berghei]SCM16709.1 conserved Plasmodium protein, unknown function [Plasmodium berghei]SCN27940.1 conserved Plasmodium protein, unknown function [Plasmodium berghei]VUC57823.1 conserved protein, unknown function [Plasmodium berghei ANKA]|eukprot:XP_034423593.1 conserved protein, unknown function [Plasmodium berghei ANKA]